MGRRLGIAVAALVLTAVVEVFIFVVVGGLIGFGWALLLLLLAMSLLGGWLLQREGVRGWRRFRTAAAGGRAPGREAVAGLVGLVGALLLLVPGFLTDVAGLVLLTPPGRRAAASGVENVAGRLLSPTVSGELFGPRRVRVRRRAGAAEPVDEPATGEVVEGEIVDGGPPGHGDH